MDKDEDKPVAIVTACIPTFDRTDDLAPTIEALLSAQRRPDLLLVSEGSPSTRRATEKIVASVTEVPCILLPPPAEANRSGNRNWLTSNVASPYTFFLDDDIDVHPLFLSEALARLEQHPEVVAVTPSARAGSGGAWVTKRGHFRPARPGEPNVFTFSQSLWRTEVLRRYPLEERIKYGYEDSDMAFRMWRNDELRIVAIDRPPHHRGFERTADVGNDKADLANSARVFVNLRRFWDDYPMLAWSLFAEVVANLYRHRRPLPRAEVPGQWKALVWRLLGNRRPNVVTTTVGSIKSIDEALH